ncbi:MAG: N-acyl-D-amino-acid deacylase family protein [Acidimicrobiales bacterium]
MSSYDIVIKGGTVVDGTGAPAQRADVGIVGDRVVEVGKVEGTAGRTIDAEGRVVTPGFVDIHSHLDAQVSWDPQCSSSCWHGVTSVVFGNCGVTFAPVHPGEHETLAKLMESVEDIPAASIMSGLPWDWESYGDYLGSIDRMRKGINVGGLVGHCAVRMYAMGERSIDKGENPTPDELALMVRTVDEAIAAGAMGFSSSRVLGHRTPDGRPVPGTWAERDELLALAEPLRKRGRGLFEVVPRFETEDEAYSQARSEISWMADVSRTSGRPLTFAFFQFAHVPDQYREIMRLAAAANADGAHLRPQSTVRGIGMMYSLHNRTQFDRSPTWRAMRGRSVAERLAAFRYPATRAQLVAEAEANGPFAADLERHYLVLGPDPDYTPDPARSLVTLAAQRGVTLADAFIDIMLEHNGECFWTFPVGNPTFEAVEDMITEPLVVLGLADSGAHVGQIMDASQPTWFLTHWLRKQQAFTLEEAIRKLTSDTADLFGVAGRGRLVPGAYADVNVLDLERMRLHMPEYVHDFPGGAGRYVQRADGYDATLVNGQVFMEHGEHTGAFAGTLLRSGPDQR